MLTCIPYPKRQKHRPINSNIFHTKQPTLFTLFFPFTSSIFYPDQEAAVHQTDIQAAAQIPAGSCLAAAVDGHRPAAAAYQGSLAVALLLLSRQEAGKADHLVEGGMAGRLAEAWEGRLDRVGREAWDAVRGCCRLRRGVLEIWFC